jgi:hypothetical protein
MFTKGKPKPATSGRRKGTPNKGTERARRFISEADDKEIVDQVVRDAKVNNPEALHVYFRHLRPPSPRPETFIGSIPPRKHMRPIVLIHLRRHAPGLRFGRRPMNHARFSQGKSQTDHQSQIRHTT